MNTVLEFKNVSYFYQDGNKKLRVLDDVNYNFEKGKFYTILGPSGSGKTTVLALASALDTVKSGEVIYDNRDLKSIGMTNYRNKNIGIVFQSYNLITYMTGLQNILTAMEITKNKIDNKKEKAYEYIERVGITREEAHRNIQKLSGGQQQRIAIARALSTNSDLILADEPTGNLDTDTASDIVNIFKELAHDDNKCVIVVTHSDEVAKQSDVIIRLKNGKLI